MVDIKFPTPFDQIDLDDYGSAEGLDRPYTLHEIAMANLSYTIRTTKPDWYRKSQDPTIRAKWKEEVLTQQKNSLEEFEKNAREGRVLENEDDQLDLLQDINDERFSHLTPEMIDYTLDELEVHHRMEEETKGSRYSCFTGILESNQSIPDELRQQLIDNVKKLEDVPEDQKDWHPGSTQVLDLVHPSLYPLRYGHSQVVIDGKSDVAEIPENLRGNGHSTSQQYCWLPTDFPVDADGTSRVDGYINNLHPDDHAALYPVLASILDRFIPMWELALSDIYKAPKHRIPVTDTEWWRPEWKWGPVGKRKNEYIEHENWQRTREIELPQPDPSADKSASFVDYKSPPINLKGRKLQVIVKLANILLTPEEPEYAGGVWHVEGMANENIVASGIYYYDQENIGESRLAFRGPFNSEEVRYEQGDERGCRVVYGIASEEKCTQDYNSLSTTENLCIAFPNLYQHKVATFSLADRTKAGHRKILCFFLVDPYQPILSTKNVPAQQRNWVARATDDARETTTLPDLPNEVWDSILKKTPSMTLEQAKEVRLKLMEERKYLVTENSEIVFERPFSLCEH